MQIIVIFGAGKRVDLLRYFMDWRKQMTRRPEYLRRFRTGSLKLSPLFQSYPRVEEVRGLKGADLVLLESTNGRAMMKYMRIMVSES